LTPEKIQHLIVRMFFSGFAAGLRARKRDCCMCDMTPERLKHVIVDPEETSIAMQRFGKQIFAATGTQETIEELLGMFYVRSVQSGYKEESR
jgi:hypothetical protein